MRLLIFEAFAQKPRNSRVFLLLVFCRRSDAYGPYSVYGKSSATNLYILGRVLYLKLPL